MKRIMQTVDKVDKPHSSQSRLFKRPHAVKRYKAATTPSSHSHPELGDISYTHTRVFKPSLPHLQKHRIVAYNKNDAMSMNFDLLRTQVLHKMKENGWLTLAITSPNPEAGKSVVAINLAMSIAQQPSKTAMLVDFDLRRPKIGIYLGLPMEHSLNELLNGTAELAEVLVNPDMPKLVVLATKHPVKESSETLSSKRIADLIKDLRDRYESRIVIFDLPPVLVADDAIALLPQIDCILMVVADGMSTRREIDESLRHLPAEKLVGIVFNKAEHTSMDYYYY